jgi:hypothetical protein
MASEDACRLLDEGRKRMRVVSQETQDFHNGAIVATSPPLDAASGPHGVDDKLNHQPWKQQYHHHQRWKQRDGGNQGRKQANNVLSQPGRRRGPSQQANRTWRGRARPEVGADAANIDISRYVSADMLSDPWATLQRSLPLRNLPFGAATTTDDGLQSSEGIYDRPWH